MGQKEEEAKVEWRKDGAVNTNLSSNMFQPCKSVSQTQTVTLNQFCIMSSLCKHQPTNSSGRVLPGQTPVLWRFPGDRGISSWVSASSPPQPRRPLHSPFQCIHGVRLFSWCSTRCFSPAADPWILSTPKELGCFWFASMYSQTWGLIHWQKNLTTGTKLLPSSPLLLPPTYSKILSHSLLWLKGILLSVDPQIPLDLKPSTVSRAKGG